MIIVDRFEENLALIEVDGNIFEVERSLLPPEAAEGSVLILDGEKYILDPGTTGNRFEAIRKRFESLRKKK